MAWASGAEARALEAEADAFGAATGRRASLTIEGDDGELPPRLAAGARPPIRRPMSCLVSARDFSGLDPERDLADATPDAGHGPAQPGRLHGRLAASRRRRTNSPSMCFSIIRSYFDQAGIGYPDRHWNWDILEADARAIDSLRLKDDAGRSIYPLELPADFDFWNILCTQAGHPALDLDVWHLADDDTKESQMRALDFIHEIFQELQRHRALAESGPARRAASSRSNAPRS